MRMKEIFTAKSIEEAKHLAVEKFGVSEDQIVFRILEEPKKGIFGKVKREAQVEAVYEAAEEAAVLVEAGLPPQAARAPAALRAPTAFKKERREITFFIMSSPYLSYRRPFIPDRSCWPYYRKSLSFCPSVAYTIFRKFSCLFRTNIWDTSYLLAIFANFIRHCSHFVIISAQFVIFNRKNIFSLVFRF